MQRATAVPRNTKINYHDHVRHAARLHLVLQLTDGLSHHTVAFITGPPFQVVEVVVVLCRP